MRLDIQFLRGVAVLLVLLFHAKLFSLPGGFLGVDVFFVISGFLITTTILKALERDQFSFVGFYLRRAKRLLPAAFTTLLVTTLLAHFVLTRTEMADFIQQLVGALTFSANFVLWSQTGYFANTAHTKPLLHMWSLSLEEQYYFALPVVLFLCYSPLAMRLFRRNPTPWVLSLGILLSFSLGALFAMRNPNVAFYFPVTRFWEMLVGSITAWMMLRRPDLAVPVAVKLGALASVLFVSFFPIDQAHPRLDAALIVGATAIMLLGKDNWIPRGMFSRLVGRIGDWSYSLYLVHWPLLAFAYSAYMGEIPWSVRCGLLAASFVLAYLQYRFVEEPFRKGWKGRPRRALAALAAGFVLVLATASPAMVPANAASVDFAPLFEPNRGLSPACGRFVRSGPPPECLTGQAPTIAVWGDSYAMHLVPGVAADPQLSIVQITRSACGPFLDLALQDAAHDPTWGKDCISFNESVLAYLRGSASISHVVLSFTFSYFAADANRHFWYEGAARPFDVNLATDRLVATVEALQEADMTPIIVAPTPSNGVNLGSCVERRTTRKLMLGRQDCVFAETEYRRKQAGVIAALKEANRRTGVAVLWPSDIICSDNVCDPVIDGVYVYRDSGHLTRPGSALIASRMGLNDVLRGHH